MDLLQSLSPALIQFADLLETRLRQRVFTTEDAVRYTFFIALTRSLQLNPHDIILEKPHPTIPGARIDAHVVMPGGPTIAIEFKYDRPIPSQKNAPRTQKAGQLLKDLFRLARLEPASNLGVFIYLATNEMAAYLHNPSNGLEDFFDLKQGATLRLDENYVSSRATTLRNSAGEVVPCVLRGILSRQLPEEHELRAYVVYRIVQ